MNKVLKAKAAAELYNCMWFDDYLWRLLPEEEEDENSDDVEYLSPAKEIFLQQMVAIAMCHDPDMNLEHVLALILLKNIFWASSSEVERRMKTSAWLRDLYDEIMAGTSKEAIFAEKCFNVDYVKESGEGALPVFSSNDFDFDAAVQEFLITADSLQNQVRGGWLNWGVKVTEGYIPETLDLHTIAAEIMALSMYLIYANDYPDVDIEHAIMMIAISHLAGENPVTDQDSSEEESEQAATFCRLVEKLSTSYPLENTFYEFLACKTPSAKFAMRSGKVSTDFQAKEYDEYVDLDHQEGNRAMKHPFIKAMIDKYHSFFEMWWRYSLRYFDYDKNFTAVLNYCRKSQ